MRIHTTSDEDGAETRYELFPVLRAELLSHAKAEEQEFYSLLEEPASTSPLMPGSQSDHDEIETLLEELHMLSLEGSAWRPIFERLRTLVNDHVKKEETEVFPRAEEFIDAERAKEIEERYLLVKERMRQNLQEAEQDSVRPHEAATPSPIPW
jgi:hypothetical protein